MNSIKRFFHFLFHPSYSSMLASQLALAREEYIQAAVNQEYYNAIVPMLKERITRLEVLVGEDNRANMRAL